MKKIAALLTGRGKSTLSGKNLLDVLGKPVLYYPANAARKSSSITSWWCSSDDASILDYAKELGYKSIVRPMELSLPTSQHSEAILHALDVMKQAESLPEILVVLLANNVSVKSSWIEESVKKMIANPDLSAVVPAYQDNDHHPLRAKTLDSDGSLRLFKNIEYSNISSNRQDLPPCYFLSHNFWVIRVDSIINMRYGEPPWGFLGEKVSPYIVSHTVDIHDSADILLAKNWILENYED